MAEKGIINGVDVDRFYEMVDAITEKPEIAKFTFHAKNQWIKDGHNRTTIDEFYGACETHKRSTRTSPHRTRRTRSAWRARPCAVSTPRSLR